MKMSRNSWLLFLPAVLALVQGHEVKYVITAPQVLRPGLEFTFSVALTENAAPSTIQASLIKKDASSVLVESPQQSIQTGESKTMSLMIPSSASDSMYTLKVVSSGGVAFSKEVSVTVEMKSTIVLIQTDKAVYKPGDKVQYRAVVLTPSLKPKMVEMEIEIRDPANNKIKVITVKAEDTQQGVYSGELQLSAFPVEGSWNIKVTAGDGTQSKAFKVEEYVLPKYEVKLEVAKNYIPTDGDLPAKVTAKYTYGKVVKGDASVEFKIVGKKHLGFRRMKELVDGVFMARLSMENIKDLWCQDIKCPDNLLDILNPTDRYYLGTATLMVTANVTEELTGKIFSQTAMVSLKSIVLLAEITGPDTFKSELPYSGLIELKGPDDGPPRSLLDNKGMLLDKYVGRNVQLQIDLTLKGADGRSSTPKKEILNIPLVKTGLMPFTIDIKEKYSTINLRVEFEGVTKKKTLNEFSSRDEQSIKVTLPDLTGTVKGDSVNFQIQSSVEITEVYVVVMSKGVIVSSTREQFAARKEHTITYAVDKAKLAPSAKLIIYTITTGGEMLPDIAKFDVDGLFTNQVTLAFDKSASKPGDDISLTVTASPESLVMLLAVDKSVQLLGTGNDITQDQVQSAVEAFDTKSGGGFPSPWGPMAMEKRRKKRSMIWPGWWGSAADAKAMFNEAGITVITDAYVHEKEDQYKYRYLYEAMPDEEARGGAAGGAVDGAVDAGMDYDDAMEETQLCTVH